MSKPKRRLRPIWQIVLLAPIALLYWPANAYVNWVDRHF